MFNVRIVNVLLLIVTILIAASLLNASSVGIEKSMEVAATAYTLREAETKKGHIGLAAWGDQLEPGMKSIAVSRDLIKKGLGHKTEVKIEGLEGTFIVRDKMNKRWKNKIDIFMGRDVKAARQWGKRKVVIRWYEEKETNY